MLRALLGKICEWALGYERTIVFNGCRRTETPRRAHSSDAGYDLYVSERTVVLPGDTIEIPTGVYIDPRSPIWLEMKARSSTFYRHGIEIQDAVIDHGYRGELFAIGHNPGTMPAILDRGVRVCQVVPHLLLPCKFKSGDLKPSARGPSGWGSTG